MVGLGPGSLAESLNLLLNLLDLGYNHWCASSINSQSICELAVSQPVQSTT